MKIGKRGTGEKLEMNMTPMIDVCFQLIIFFMVSLRLFSPEGDFSIKMPQVAPTVAPPENPTLPIKVQLRAGPDGKLASIQMGERQMRDFRQLHQEIRGLSPDASGPPSSDAEVELDCDYNLRFDYAIQAITAVSGYLDQGRIVKLIDKIRFSQPKKQ